MAAMATATTAAPAACTKGWPPSCPYLVASASSEEWRMASGASAEWFHTVPGWANLASQGLAS